MNEIPFQCYCCAVLMNIGRRSEYICDISTVSVSLPQFVHVVNEPATLSAHFDSVFFYNFHDDIRTSILMVNIVWHSVIRYVTAILCAG